MNQSAEQKPLESIAAPAPIALGVVSAQPVQLGAIQSGLERPELAASRPVFWQAPPGSAILLSGNMPLTSYVAGVSMMPSQLVYAMMPAPGTNAPFNVMSGQSIYTIDNQLAEISRRHDIHTQMDFALQEAFASKMQSMPEQLYEQIHRAVHDAMAEIMAGCAMMRVPPDEVFHLIDTLRDQALHYHTEIANGGKPCMHTLRERMKASPAAQKFERKKHNQTIHGHFAEHHEHGHPAMNNTGPSLRILASSAHAEGHVAEEYAPSHSFLPHLHF